MDIHLLNLHGVVLNIRAMFNTNEPRVQDDLFPCLNLALTDVVFLYFVDGVLLFCQD